MMTSFIIWNIDPQIFSFAPVRWYGLLFAVGFIISQQVMYYIYKKEGKPQKDIDTLTIFMIVATIIGARLGHIFFYEPQMLLERPLEILLPFRFSPEFKFVGLQGLASHGGAAGILFALWLYARYDITFKGFKFSVKRIKREGQSYLQVLDRIVIVVAITGCMIRFGNYMNSEIVGKPTESAYGVVFARNVTEVFTGVNSPIENIDYISRSGDANSLGYYPITLSLTMKQGAFTEKEVRRYVERTFGKTLHSYSYVTDNIYHNPDKPLEYTLEVQDNKYVAHVNAFGIARHPAQLYESISNLLLFVILFLMWNRKKKDTPKGRLLAIFLIVVFGLRFFYEFLKENQVSFEDNIPLNMGQWLSIPLVIAGVVILIRSFKSPEKLSE